MKLGEHLDVSHLRVLMASKHISMQKHPTLPLAILNYTNSCMFDDFWPDTVQKCRGLIIETAKFSGDIIPESTIISRPFHKFFNLNHTNQQEYQEQNLPSVEPTVTEKMDGWFGIMWKYNCDGEGFQYGVSSRGSFTSPGAVFATQKLQKLVKYGAVDEFPEGYSPIFEIIFPEGKVVIDYPFEGLVLLGCVNNETGEELPYDDLQKVWAKIAGYAADNRPWIRLVKAHRMTLGECSNHNAKNFEGFVLTYPRPGTYPIKVKVKLEEYKRLHKLITGVTPQQIWRALHDPMAQWFESDIPESFRKWALKWRDELYTKFNRELIYTYASIDDLWELPPTKSILEDRTIKAAYYLEAQKHYPDKANLMLMLLEEKYYEAHQAIWNSLRPVGRATETFYREGDKE